MKAFPSVADNIRKLLGYCSQRVFESQSLVFGETRLCAGLFFLTWVSALSLPFELWPYFLSLPILLFNGISRLALAWCLIILWIWLGIPSVPGRGFALLKAILPVVAGSASGRFLRKKQADFLGVMLVVLIPFCIMAVVQWMYRIPVPQVWLSSQERWMSTTRVMAIYQNPNLFAEVLLFLLPIGLTWTLSTRRRLFRGIGWGWVFLTFVSLVWTFSLGAWIAVFFSLSVWAAMHWARRPGETVLLMTILAMIVLALFGTYHGSTAVYRWALWQEAWHVFLRNPWGVGPGGLRDFLVVSQTPSNHGHNLFLQILAETGLLGLPVIFLILRKVGLQITTDKDFQRAGVVAALTGLILYGMVDYIWATPLMTGLFWLGEGMLDKTT